MTSRRPSRSARRSCLPDLKLSADGLYYWDGQRWVSTLSQDGRSRWNGSMWVAVGPVPPPMYFQPAPLKRVATGWTKPLQYSVAGWYLLQAIYAITLPFFMARPMADYMNQFVQRQTQLNPGTTPPPADFLATMTNAMTVVLAVGSAIAVAIAVVAIIGALKGWTWIFYVVLVLLGFQTVSLPLNVVGAFATSAFLPMQLPVGLTWASITLGVPAAALFIWMLVAVFRRGPWAMTRVVPG